jgi:hypothetical protein
MMGAALATGVAGSLPARLALAAPKGGAPWRLLFNGVDLTGWNFFQEGVGETDRLGAVAIEDGVLRLQGPAYEPRGETGFGHLATAESFSNFHLRLDFKWGGRRFAPRSLAKRNSGILYHMAPSKGVLYPDCIEFQVEETDVGDAILINVQGLEGISLGGTPVWPNYPPFLPRTYSEPQVFAGLARQWFHKTGDFEIRDGWNTLDIIAFEDQAAHLVNGRVVTTMFGLVQKPEEGKPRVPLTGGRIALELEGAEIAFKNIMIRSLGADDIALMRKG